MADELYIIHKETGARYAVPKAHFEDVLKAEGYVIDPDGPSAGQVDTRTLKASERAIATAEAKKTAEAE